MSGYRFSTNTRKAFCFENFKLHQVNIIYIFIQFNFEYKFKKIFFRFLRYELKQLGIFNKIVAISTDNEADMKRAVNQLCDEINAINGYCIRIPCLAHILHLIVTNGLSLWKKKTYENTFKFKFML